MRAPHPSRGFRGRVGILTPVHTANTLGQLLKMPLDLVFCGTPPFAVPTLEKLVRIRPSALIWSSRNRTAPKAVASERSRLTRKTIRTEFESAIHPT